MLLLRLSSSVDATLSIDLDRWFKQMTRIVSLGRTSLWSRLPIIENANFKKQFATGIPIHSDTGWVMVERILLER